MANEDLKKRMGIKIKDSNSSKKHKLKKRRKYVSELYEKRYTMREIAELVEVDVAQIQRDIKYLETQWEKETADNIELIRKRELADLDRMENICITKIDACEGKYKGIGWMEEWRKIKVRRAELMGLDAAKKYSVREEGSKIKKSTKDKMIGAVTASKVISIAKGK